MIKISLLLFIAFSAGVSLVLTGTRPESIGLLGVVGFFVLVYGAMINFFLLLYALRTRRPPIRFRSMLKAAVLALGPVMLLAMSSTSSLRILDVGLVILFELAALFYISRTA